MSLANEPVLIAALPVADRTVVSPFGSVSANTLLDAAFIDVTSWFLVFTRATLLWQQLWIFPSCVGAWAIGGPRRKPASPPAVPSAIPSQFLRPRKKTTLPSRPRSVL